MNALVNESGAQHLRELGVVLRHNGLHFQNGHLGAQVPVSLSHLDAHRSPADDEQMIGDRIGIEYGFIGVKRNLGQPRNRWQKG